jgi:cyclopropane-fatty-acyl-phospholipid synthase
MAERMPQSSIVAVSNSAAQRAFIEAAAVHKGLSNVSVITADMNEFAMEQRFDRIVSVEMFEHMTNWRALLSRVRTWLAPDGRLYLHVFASRGKSFRFDARVNGDFIARYFFTGGIMPNVDLIREFADLFTVEHQYWWSGRHYERTALDWLANFDAQGDALTPVIETTYGADAPLWRRRWRRFFLITAGMFGHANGDVWGVAHYLLRGADRS